MIGTVSLAASAADGIEMEGEVTPLEHRFRIPAGEYLAIDLARP
jgi:hypothetical protein